MPTAKGRGLYMKKMHDKSVKDTASAILNKKPYKAGPMDMAPKSSALKAKCM